MNEQTGCEEAADKGSSTENLNRGCLTLVATPIGNYDDISARALAVLGSADLIAAEDTRVTARLLKHFDLVNSLESYHEHNQAAKGEKLLALLKSGAKIALVSDAGMPCISDPGEDLVRTCIEQDIPVSVIPGANAGLAALSASGLDTSSYVFEGFLSLENKVRHKQMSQIANQLKTTILYEAPHRLQRTLTDLRNAGLGERRIVMARELTKRYEEWLRTSVDEACEYYMTEKPRGEYVLILEGENEFAVRCPPDPADIEAQASEIMRELLDQGMSVREAAKKAAESGLLKKNDFYRIGLNLQSE